jgi:hypothetical protein
MDVAASKKRSAPRGRKVAGTVVHVVGVTKQSESGKFKWRVSDGKSIRTVTTSKRSLDSINRAMKKFGSALTRLADK